MALAVGYAAPPRPVRFLSRPNRYVAWVRPCEGGPRFRAHVPNPGRMSELLLPGVSEGWVVAARAPRRRTAYDLVAVRHGRAIVSIDSRIANRLVGLTLRAEPAAAPGRWRSEVPVGRERFDFGCVDGEGRPTRLLEVKSSNWRIADTAMFPDAPSARGARHLRALARAAADGVDARVWFVVQRSDTRSFAIHRLRDPGLAEAFDRARDAGVQITARSLRVRPDGVRWGARLPVRTNGPLGTYKDGGDPSPVR